LSLPVTEKLTVAPHEPASLQTVIGFGTEIVGDSQSLTVTLNEHWSVLPAASVVTTVTAVVPIGKVEPEAGVATVVEPEQLSLPEALNVTTAPQAPASLHAVMSAGQLATGFSQSLTVTVNEQFTVRPAASVPTTLTVVVPTGKVEPEAGVATTVEPGQLSCTDGWKVTTAPQAPVSLHWVIAVGQVTTGSSQSLTVTVNVLLEVLPAASVAVVVTVVVPIGKLEPEAGTEDTLTPAQLSLPVAVKVTIAPHAPASLQTVIGLGTETVGFSQSVTVTLNEQLDVLPAASVAVALTTVVPTGKSEPEAGVATTVTPAQLSAPGTEKVTTAPHWP
jgi:hypothetical protein